jgi:hypothetical protein
MKNYEEVIAKASRVEYDKITGRLFIVFEVVSEVYKKKIRSEWNDDIEYRIIGTNLIINKEK